MVGKPEGPCLNLKIMIHPNIAIFGSILSGCENRTTKLGGTSR
jgi:hypothetical protein